MKTAFEQIDPAWAWAPFEPGPDQPWTRRRAAHLLRRAGFGASSAQLDAAVSKGVTATVNELVSAGTNKDSSVDEFASDVGRMTNLIMGGGKADDLGACWLYRMIHSPDPCGEKLTLFWHGHFAVSAAKIEPDRVMKGYDSLLRRHARGSFPALALGMAQDPAMLIWLDSTVNRKARPNENFARELMELFCLGPGNYTEHDIREMARAFTGWEVKSGRFVVNSYQHDTGVKEFLGQKGTFEGEDAVRIVTEHPAAPRYIAGKLARFFVCEEPLMPHSLLEPLAQALVAHRFEIAPVLHLILASNLFFSQTAMAGKVRSPVELGAGLLRALEASTDCYALHRRLGQLGQSLYFPPNVKGWDGGRTWINSSTLLGRANLVHALVHGKSTRYQAGGLWETIRAHGAPSADDALAWLEELLLARTLTDEVRRRVLSVTDGVTDREEQARRLLCALSLLPEFQFG